MNTFLPSSNFTTSARVLDRTRLGSQRREAWTILNILTSMNPSARGWYNHPAVQMWRGSEAVLKLYLRAIILEWVDRGYENNIPLPLLSGEIIRWPWWLGDERLHSSHRANLLRKDYKHYSQFGWSDTPDSIYFWPSPDRREGRFLMTNAKKRLRRSQTAQL